MSGLPNGRDPGRLAGRLLVLLALLVTACSAGETPGQPAIHTFTTRTTSARSQEAVRARRAERLTSARCWAPVFGSGDASSVTGFDLVVVDGIADRSGFRVAREDDVARWHTEDALVFAYLSIGTAEDWRHYAPRVREGWTLGPVDGWPGERYVDAREPGWRELMVHEAQTLSRLGFDGLYLDNLDVAEDFPATRQGVVETIAAIGAAQPELLLVGQNGLHLVEDLAIDAVAHEDVWWQHDGDYVATRRTTTTYLVGRLTALRRSGLPVFTLDYTPPGHPAAAEIIEASRRLGFSPAVTTIALDRPPHATACP
jgi:cysteinyl-tRNA synthetase, unknown class